MPDFTALLIHSKIAAVCPIDGVSIGDPSNSATWSIVPSVGATAQQIEAGQQALAAITPAALAAADATVEAARAAIPDPLAAAKASAVSSLPTAVAEGAAPAA